MLLFMLIVSLQSRAQQTINLNNLVNVTLPEGTKSISAALAEQMVSKKALSAISLETLIKSFRSRIIYEADSVIFILLCGDKPVEPGHLTGTKDGLDEMFKGNLTYTSSMLPDANKRLLVIRYTMGDLQYCRFFSWDLKYTKSLTGTLLYDKRNSSAGNKIFDELYKGINFKVQ